MKDKNRFQTITEFRQTRFSSINRLRKSQSHYQFFSIIVQKSYEELFRKSVTKVD